MLREPSTLATYAVVQDVPASWDVYLAGVESLGERVPQGLLIHVAGPTDEGFRVIDVWESQASWERFPDDLLDFPVRSVATQRVRTTVRHLVVQHLLSRVSLQPAAYQSEGEHE